MKFTINRATLYSRITNGSKSKFPTKTTIPILTGVKIELNSEGLNLTGSNADISIETFLAADDEKAELQIAEIG